MRGATSGAAFHRIGFAAALAAASACTATSAGAQSYYHQSRPSVTYQPSQRYQSSQPSRTYQSSQPSRTYQSPQPTTSSSSTSSSSSPSYTSQSSQRQQGSQPTIPPVGQTAKPSGTLAENSARCTNSDRSVQPDTSISSCNAVIHEATKNLAAGYFFRGAAYIAKNDFDRAIADYSQAIALDPTESDYLNSRAAAYEHKKDIARAMADYDSAIKVNPKSAVAYNNRGASFQRKGDFARASADYSEVTRLQPNNADAWAARCWVRAAGGREVQQALADCNQALKIKADAPDVLDTRGFVNLRLGKMDDAIRDYDAALKLDPKLAGALYGRGIAKMKKGDRNGGSADMAAAKSISSGIEAEFSRYGIR
jgi:tetratricopeptide (TPR) repeat protein